MQAYPAYPQVSYPQYSQYDSLHQQAYWSQPPSYQDEREPSSDGVGSDTSSDDMAPNPHLNKITQSISQTVGDNPLAYEQAIFSVPPFQAAVAPLQG